MGVTVQAEVAYQVWGQSHFEAGGGSGSNQSCMPPVAIQRWHWRVAYQGVPVGGSGSAEVAARVGLVVLAR